MNYTMNTQCFNTEYKLQMLKQKECLFFSKLCNEGQSVTMLAYRNALMSENDLGWHSQPHTNH